MKSETFDWKKSCWIRYEPYEQHYKYIYVCVCVYQSIYSPGECMYSCSEVLILMCSPSSCRNPELSASKSCVKIKHAVSSTWRSTPVSWTETCSQTHFCSQFECQKLFVCTESRYSTREPSPAAAAAAAGFSSWFCSAPGSAQLLVLFSVAVLFLCSRAESWRHFTSWSVGNERLAGRDGDDTIWPWQGVPHYKK